MDGSMVVCSAATSPRCAGTAGTETSTRRPSSRDACQQTRLQRSTSVPRSHMAGWARSVDGLVLDSQRKLKDLNPRCPLWEKSSVKRLARAITDLACAQRALRIDHAKEGNQTKPRGATSTPPNRRPFRDKRRDEDDAHTSGKIPWGAGAGYATRGPSIVTKREQELSPTHGEESRVAMEEKLLREEDACWRRMGIDASKARMRNLERLVEEEGKKRKALLSMERDLLRQVAATSQRAAKGERLRDLRTRSVQRGRFISPLFGPHRTEGVNA